MARTLSANRNVVRRNYVKSSPTRVVKLAAHGLAAAAYQLTAATQNTDYDICRIEDSTMKLTFSDNTFAEWKGYFADGLDFNDPNGIALSFYVPDSTRGTDASAASYMAVNISNDATSKTTPGNRSKHAIYMYEVRNGWNYIRMRPDNSSTDAAKNSTFGQNGWEATGTGGVLTSAVKWVSIQFYNMKNRTVYLEGLYRGGSQRTKYVWMFDNWGANLQTIVDAAFPDYGWEWMIDVPHNYIDADSDLFDRIEGSLALGGHIVLNDITDRNLATAGLDRYEIQSMIEQNKAEFDRLGWEYDDRFFIYNNNTYSDEVIAGLQLAGIKYARAGTNEMWINCDEQGIANPYRYGSKSMDNTVYSTLKTRLDRLVQYQGTAHWYMHNIVTGGTEGGSAAAPDQETNPLSMYSEDFIAYYKYVRELELQGLLDVVTLAEWYDGL